MLSAQEPAQGREPRGATLCTWSWRQETRGTSVPGRCCFHGMIADELVEPLTTTVEKIATKKAGGTRVDVLPSLSFT